MKEHLLSKCSLDLISQISTPYEFFQIAEFLFKKNVFFFINKTEQTIGQMLGGYKSNVSSFFILKQNTTSINDTVKAFLAIFPFEPYSTYNQVKYMGNKTMKVIPLHYQISTTLPSLFYRIKLHWFPWDSVQIILPCNNTTYYICDNSHINWYGNLLNRLNHFTKSGVQMK